MSRDMSERMSEDMSEGSSECQSKDVRRNVKRYVRKNVRKDVRKIPQLEGMHIPSPDVDPRKMSLIKFASVQAFRAKQRQG